MRRPRTVRDLRSDAETIFRAGLAAVDAGEAVARHLSLDRGRNLLRLGDGRELSLSGFRRVFVVGAGKAAAPMAAAVERIIEPAFPAQGIVNVKYGHTTPRPRFIELHECGHPLPDQAGVEGARAIERILSALAGEDLLFVVVSGGASALLPAPAEGISLEEKQRTTELLLRAGADIHELNAVRKHLSTLKGGQLALRARPATVIALILSDVVGDRLDVIGSGLTACDPSTFADAARVLQRYNLAGSTPAAVARRIDMGIRQEIPETPKDAGSGPGAVLNLIVGSNRLALESAAAAARSLGFHTLVLSSTLEGESREVARVHAAILREVLATGNPLGRPACILSGGETTATVRGDGRGGRNQEFALAAAIAIDGLEDAVILAAGTDGTDGPTDAAGAIVDGTTASRACGAGLSPHDHLARNDSYTILDRAGDLLRTGATGTNVMDINILLAGGA